MPQYKSMRLSGWGRYPTEECQVARPERRRDLRDLFAPAAAPPPAATGKWTFIPRGLGRSYGDSALNPSGVILDERLNRLISFDPATGVVECEAGTSLADLIGVFLPRGFFLPVTPGTKFVTVGGAIAADVHGKNHHRDGSFGNYVERFTLLTASGEVLTCSPTDNADVFWATVGGMGLTGIILTAAVRLRRVESSYLNVDYLRVGNLDSALEAFDEGDARYLYSVAWIDCLSTGNALGRSVLMRGDHASPRDLPPELRGDPLAVANPRKKSVPFDFPTFALNRSTVSAFNAVFYEKNASARRVVGYDPFFYPLDAVSDWNRMYGKRGFVQFQAFFPRETSRRGLIELLEQVAASGRASFLAVLKSSGAAGNGLLSYLSPGHTLALDLAWNDGLAPLLKQLDRTLLRHGGRLYLAKDATMGRDTFATMYPNLEPFKAIKRRLDPNGRFASTQARRVGLVEGD